MAGVFRLGRIPCSLCRHDILRQTLARPAPTRNFHAALVSFQQEGAIQSRSAGWTSGAGNEPGFFERSFLKSGRRLSLGSGHVGKSIEVLDEAAGSVKDEAVAYSASAEAASFAKPFWRPPPALTLRRRIALYQALAKSRLSSLVVLTAMAGYAMAPPAIGPAPAALALFDALPFPGGVALLSTALGTFLCSASANTINQVVEAPYDALMSRTRGRPMVRRLCTSQHAAVFAAATGTAGVALLVAAVNPVTAALGFANIVLYAFVYTPLKRQSIVNTWVGAVVGAIPPLMGWAASTGGSLAQPGAWLLAAASFAWQFPHFDSFAHLTRRDYARAGYRMMAVSDPALNARVSLRYAIALFPLCSWAVPAVGMTTWAFAGLSLAPNALMAVPAYRFWRYGGDREARRLFWASLVHLPVLLVLMMACKAKPAEDRKSASEQ